MKAGIEADAGITTEASNWVFDEHVAPHFDDHVRKSVPEYDRVQDLAAKFSDWFTHPDCTVLDFGAASGETLRPDPCDDAQAIRRGEGFPAGVCLIARWNCLLFCLNFRDLKRGARGLPRVPATFRGVSSAPA